MGCTYAIWVIWQIPLIDRLDHIDRPYLKCQVILDFEQQMLTSKMSSHAGPSALSFSRQGASIWIIKSKILYFSYDGEKTADSQIPFR